MELTGLIPGQPYVVTDVLNTTTVNVQNPTSAAEIPFGRLVLMKGYSPVAHRAANELTRLATTAAFAAQSDTVQVTAFDAASTYLVSIETDSGYRADFVVPGNASANQTAADIEAALDADLVLVSEGITAGVVADLVTITSATAGFGFKTSIAVVGGAGTMALVATYGIAVSLLAAAAGVSMSTLDDEQLVRGGDISLYRPNDPVKGVTGGHDLGRARRSRRRARLRCRRLRRPDPRRHSG